MSKLAELLERTFTLFFEMLADLGLELLFESVELTLISIEIIVVALLGQVSHNFTGWIVEVSLLTVWSKLAFLIFHLGLARRPRVGRVLFTAWDLDEV